MCPKSYYYHYMERIRPTTQTGALAFGSALDSALNELLVPTGKDASSIFLEAFTHQYINGVKNYTPTSLNMVYSNNDFDGELLTDDDLAFMNGELNKIGLSELASISEAGQKVGFIKKLKSEVGMANISPGQVTTYNLINWTCLKAKGLLMLDAYKEKVLPLIEKVHVVQKQVSLVNEDGDSITGFVDLIADVKGHGTVILDNKTSGMRYEKDSVRTSPQLALYTNIEGPDYGTDKAGFIVMLKNVMKNRTKKCTKCGHNGTGSRAKTCDNTIDNKRCGGEWDEAITPEIDIQIIIDTIPKQLEIIVLENFSDVNDAIKQKHFTRNLHSCTNTYGGLCPYYSLCFEGNMRGLKKND